MITSTQATTQAIAHSTTPTANRRAAPAPAASMLLLQIRQIRFEASGILSYELVDPQGAELPPVSAGSHIDVHLPGGITRQYSLCNDPAERHRYVIAVLFEAAGRGGSIAVHGQCHVQDLLSISAPRNHFAIAPDATKHVLLAGGIGITPLKAMAHQLERSGQDYVLHYCAKGQEWAAFREQFAPLVAAGRVVFHFDGGVPGAGLDIAALLDVHAEGSHLHEGSHLYYCGPPGFMAACAAAAAHWPAGSVHCEHFKAPASVADASDASVDADAAVAPAAAVAASADGFLVKIASTGQTIAVSQSQSIVDALGDVGIVIPTSCESGLCGTCKTRYLSGNVDHRDVILGDGEQVDQLTLCVSRCNSDMLVLDL